LEKSSICWAEFGCHLFIGQRVAVLKYCVEHEFSLSIFLWDMEAGGLLRNIHERAMLQDVASALMKSTKDFSCFFFGVC
jgi:hypothetical protein